MLCKGSEDLELCHEPIDEGNILQKDKINEKYVRSLTYQPESQLRQFFVYEVL